MNKSQLNHVAALVGLEIPELKAKLGYKPDGKTHRLSDAEAATLTNLVDQQVALVHDKAFFHERLGAIRRFLGWSCADLSRRVEVSRESARLWERSCAEPGAMCPTEQRAHKIAEVMGVPFTYLWDGDLTGVAPNLPIGRRIGVSQEGAIEALFSEQERSRIRPTSLDDARRKLVKPNIARMAREAGGAWVLSPGGQMQFEFWTVVVKRRKGPTAVGSTPILQKWVEKAVDNKTPITDAWSAACAECVAQGIDPPHYPSAYAHAIRYRRRQADKIKLGSQIVT